MTLNIGDSEDGARDRAFDGYISQYYPELCKAMDLSNWGPVGTPSRSSSGSETFAAAGVDHFICRFGSLDQFGQVERFAREVLPALRGRAQSAQEGSRMPSEAKIREHAELIVDTCFTVDKGDVVTIICDDEHAAPRAGWWPRSRRSGAPGR